MKPSVVIAAVVLVIALAGCKGDDPATLVSDEDARAVLGVAVGAVQSGRIDSLCAEMRAPQSTCRTHLSLVGAGSVPTQAPVVIASDAVPPSHDNANPGRLLIVCGIDGIGRQYQTGFLVYREQAGFVAPYPIFWSGTPISTQLSPGATTPSEPGEALARCRQAGIFSAASS